LLLATDRYQRDASGKRRTGQLVGWGSSYMDNPQLQQFLAAIERERVQQWI
jgi:hypothetical protein